MSEAPVKEEQDPKEGTTPKLSGKDLIAKLMKGFEDGLKARPPPKAYKVKHTKPFPPGYLKLDMNGFGSMYMGRDEDINDGEGFPVYGFRVNIRYKEPDDFDEEDEGEIIGHISGWVVKASQGDFTTACDVVSEELHQMALLLFDENGYRKHDDDDIFMEMMGDVLYIESVFVEPKYRGYGVGLLAIHHLMNQLPSHGQLLVVLAPCPINSHFYERRDKSSTDPFSKQLSKEEHTAAIKRIGEYYSLMGFKKWTTDEQDKRHSLGLGIWGLWLGYVQPDIRKVVPHLFKYPKARLNGKY